ncbi:hypothetical protein PIB30_084704, partial [Stylosanthes scabra]|nr:hypothetical protein [Stylosanthes scabra]
GQQSFSSPPPPQKQPSHLEEALTKMFHLEGPTTDMYEVFTCGDQMMYQIAQEYLDSRPSEAPRAGSVDAPVYRPEPPLQYHHD